MRARSTDGRTRPELARVVTGQSPAPWGEPLGWAQRFRPCRARVACKKLRLWTLGVHLDSGNSGMIVNDDAETLVLICVCGFRTEAGKINGVKMFAGKTAGPSFTVAFDMIMTYQKKANLAQVHSL